jgi:hypothetical protein
MKYFILIFIFSFSLMAKITLSSKQKEMATTVLKSWWPLSKQELSAILEGEVVAWSEVKSKNEEQSMLIKVAGLHPRTCGRALRKISQYENYDQFMGFIKKAKYQEEQKLISWTIDHTLLPFPMILEFQMSRLSQPGEYPFQFMSGIFKNLNGLIKIASIENRCLLFMDVKWHGQTTKIPNLVVEAFAQTLSKLGLENLIRISTL